MKFLKYIGAAVAIASLSACSLDETYNTELDQNVVYETEDGYNGLINACYTNLYYLYGKEDGIPMMEMGDLWTNGSSTSGNWKECVNNYEWNTECGVNKVVWNALYATIAYCNTAIYYKDRCPGYGASADTTSTAESEAKSRASEKVNTAILPKVAEAYFMRGFAYFHVVEQWGGVTLTTTSMAEEGAREYAYRSTEDKIYDQIISDLMFAYSYLPATQGEERGRANKYAAAAMLCKAWIQRSRLEKDFKENPDGKTKWVSQVTDSSAVKYSTIQCADSAYKYAQIVIGHYDYYHSTATASGSTQLWDGENNKNNKEFIMVEAIDHANGYNPEVWNRGRTRQYYMMNVSGSAADFGVSGTGVRYGRSNTTRVRPTLYLLQDCFDPKPSETDAQSIVYDGISTSSKDLKRANMWTADTRFDDSFYYKYYIGSSTFIVPKATLKASGKWADKDKNPDAYTEDSLYWMAAASRYTITGNVVSPEQLKSSYAGMNYYADNGTMASTEVIELETKAGALGCYTPNFSVDSVWAHHKKYIVAGLPATDAATEGRALTSYMGENGAVVSNSHFRSLAPSLKKLSPLKYCYTNQQSMNDFPIIRLMDIYLLGAEATLLSGKNTEKGLEWLKTVRLHAAKSTNASKILEGVELSFDYLAKERARELCGENWRWYDLKRMGLLTSDYLNGEHRNVYGQTYQSKWRVRPIPQQMLDQIANPDEYGTNGY